MKKRTLSVLLAFFLLLSALPTGALAAVRNYGDIPIYLGDAGVDYMAEEILKEIPTQGKSSREKIQAVYDWIIRNCKREGEPEQTYFDPDVVNAQAQAQIAGMQEKADRGEIIIRPEFEGQSVDPFSGLVSYDSNMYIGNFAANMMLYRVGNCAHYSALLALLLGHLGFDCHLIPGEFINKGGSQVEHKWNYVLVDGKYYWLDVRMDHAASSGSKISHKYFMVEDTGEWAERHSWDHDYSDWLASSAAVIADEYVSFSTYCSDEPWQRCAGWAREQMKTAYEQGLIPDCLLGRDLTKTITRSEFAAAAVALYENLNGGQPAPDYVGDSPFSDTDDADVLKAYSLGVVKGTGAGTFSPDGLLSREQACTMLGRVCELVRTGSVGDGSVLYHGGAQPFSDDGGIASYAKNYIYFFAGEGVLTGPGDGSFQPGVNMDRQSALKVSAETARVFPRP